MMPQRYIGTARQAVCSHTQQLHIRTVQHSKLGEVRISCTREWTWQAQRTHTHTDAHTGWIHTYGILCKQRMCRHNQQKHTHGNVQRCTLQRRTMAACRGKDNKPLSITAILAMEYAGSIQTVSYPYGCWQHTVLHKSTLCTTLSPAPF